MRRTVSSFAAAGVFFATVVMAQQPVLRLTATSVNVSESGNDVRIDLARWSTDQERNQLVTALTPPAPAPAAVPAPPAAAPAAGAEGAVTRGGRGGARGGAAGARGGGARAGGRGGGNAGPVDPVAAFTTAIGRAPTIGYIWTNEVTGYAIKHALRLPSPDGSERIILATNRRIGANTLSWTPARGTPTPYEFTLLEIRLTAGGSGEGKASLTANITVENEAGAIGLENYATVPALLEKVKRHD